MASFAQACGCRLTHLPPGWPEGLTLAGGGASPLDLMRAQTDPLVAHLMSRTDWLPNPLTWGQAVEARVLLGMTLGERGVYAMAHRRDLVDNFRRAWLAGYNGGDGWRARPVFAVAIQLGIMGDGANPGQPKAQQRQKPPRGTPGYGPHMGDTVTSESDSTNRPRLSDPASAERWQRLSRGPKGVIDVDTGSIVVPAETGGADSDASAFAETIRYRFESPGDPDPPGMAGDSEGDPAQADGPLDPSSHAPEPPGRLRVFIRGQ